MATTSDLLVDTLSRVRENVHAVLESTPQDRLGKEFSAVGIALLAEEGLLGYDDPLSRHLPSLPAWADRVRVAHLLTYTSGLPPLRWFDVEDDGEIMADLMATRALEFEPGTDYAYNNNDVFLRQRVIEAVSGMSFAEFVRTRLFAPCGMTNAVVDAADDDPTLARDFDDARVEYTRPGPMSGTVAVSATDLHAWARCLGSGDLVSPPSLLRLTESFDDGQSGIGMSGVRDGVIEWHGHIGQAGAYEALLYVNNTDEITVVLLTNSKQQRVGSLAGAIENIVGGEPYELPMRSLEIALRAAIERRGFDDGMELLREIERQRSGEFDLSRLEHDLVETGEYLMEQGRCDDAGRVYRLVLSRYPDNEDARLALDGFACDDRLSARITIARVSADRWQVDYRFSEPVTALELGRPIAGYRAESWTVATPGVSLIPEDGVETLVAADSARTHMRVFVERHVPFSQDAYVPMVPFSDGGVALYVGYFTGVARAGGAQRELEPSFRFVPLPSERVEPPAPGVAEAFAYFGASQPAGTEHARLILDPALPDWLRDELLRTIDVTTDVLSDAVSPLSTRPLMLIGAHEFDRYDGGSLKGGVIGGRLVILLRGRAFAEPSPAKRAIVQRLVAHEIAHLFQLETIPSGAYNFDEPWLHEGAAEAMAIVALGESGLWGPARVDRYAAAAGSACRDALAGRTLADAVRAGRGDAIYPCGLDLFWSMGDGPVEAWVRLAGRARQGRPFSTQTLEE